jgi:hypothetical protein
MDVTYDQNGEISGANVSFKNGNTLSLARNAQTGEFAIRDYKSQSGGIDNSRGLERFLSAQREIGINTSAQALGISAKIVDNKFNQNSMIATGQSLSEILRDGNVGGAQQRVNQILQAQGLQQQDAQGNILAGSKTLDVSRLLDSSGQRLDSSKTPSKWPRLS